jgi:hypothetical protein
MTRLFTVKAACPACGAMHEWPMATARLTEDYPPVAA